MKTCCCMLAALAPLTWAQSTNKDIHKDVVVIGGGPSGTYAAVNLRDRGTSVVVVEKQAVLGGNVHSYLVPGTNTSVEYGVHGLEDAPTLRSWYRRFNLSLTEYPAAAPGPTIYADFAKGTNLSTFSPPTPNFDPYLKQLDKYPFLLEGVDKIPDPVPSDLYLPYRDFVQKYGLQNAVFATYVAGQGLGHLLDQPTLYIMLYFDRLYTESIVGVPRTAYVPKDADQQEIFRRAQTELGTDVLYSSTVQSATRNSTGVSLTVKTPTGMRTIHAKKLLVTIRPTEDNMTPFGLDTQEMHSFSQFGFTGWYVALVNNTGFTEGTTYQNVGPNQPYNLSVLPSVYTFTPTKAPGIFWVRYGSTNQLSADKVQGDIIDTVKRLRPLGNGHHSGPPKVVAYSSHTPFQLTVSADAIKNNFYRNLSMLQGHRSTFYSGISFIAPHYTSVLNLTQEVLPRLS